MGYPHYELSIACNRFALVINFLMATIKIDDVEYDSDNLSENAKAQVVSLQFVQAEINKLQSRIAVYQTAATAYTTALKSELDK